MIRPLGTAAAAALCALVAAGCGVGPGDEAGRANLTVTRDYGSQQLVSEEVEIRESDTALSILDREADIDTRYGGEFVQSIDGIAGAESDGRLSDWFYYVNGIESDIGAGAYGLADGDRVWWDYRDWSTAMRVPAVVGSWPEPFLHDYREENWSVGVFCAGAEGACAEVDRVLSEQGVETGAESPEGEGADGEIRVLVGPWDAVSEDPVAALLARGPDRSGVFASFAGLSPSVGLTLLDARGRVAETLGREAGLVAALRPDDEPPTWVVTGTDVAGVSAAVDLLRLKHGDPLVNRYAVATVSNGPIFEVPVP